MPRPTRDALNAALTNNQVDAMRVIRAGDAWNQATLFFRGTTDANDRLVLPEAAKAAAVLQAFVTAGGSEEYKAPVAPDVTLVGGDVKLSPTGDVQFFGGEATSVVAEVVYAPMPGPIFEDLVDVASSSATLLQSRAGLLLLEAEVITGATPGVVTPILRGGTPAGGEAALSNDGLSVVFNAADVVGGTARIKYIAAEIEGVTRAPLVARLNDDQGAL